MSGRDRLLDTAIRIGLISVILAAGVVLLPLAISSTNSLRGQQHNNAYTYNEQRSSDHFAAAVEHEQQRASVQQNPCDQSRRSKDEDLCQQWRMAEAAEKGLTIGIIQAFLTVAALFFTGWAAFAAAVAARAAQNSVTVAERDFRETGRPELEPVLISHGLNEALNDPTGLIHPFAAVRLVNAGGRTAVIQDKAIWFHFGESAPDPSAQAVPFTVSYTRHIEVRPEGHDTAVSFSAPWNEDVRKRMWQHGTHAFLLGYIPYIDKRGFEWERGFIFAFQLGIASSNDGTPDKAIALAIPIKTATADFDRARKR